MPGNFPHNADQLSCENLTQLLQSLYPHTRVEKFTVTETATFDAEDDQVSTAGRIGLEVKLLGEHADSLNDRWIIKVCRPDLGDLPLYENEVNFYTRIRPEIAIEAPQCFGGEYHAGAGSFGIAMEDLRRRDAKFPTVKSDLSLQQVKSLLRELATLHATYWESPRFASGLDWVQPHTAGPIYTLFNHPDLVPAMIAQEIENNQFKKELVEAAGQTADGLYREFRKLQQHQATLPQTLCHGDSHIGNTYLLPNGNGGLLDWQLMARGYCMHDVTYLLMTSLGVGMRRQYQRELLGYYRKQLTKAGLGNPPDTETLWLEYRRSAVWGVYIGWLTTPIANYGWDITVNNIIRLLTTYMDLECSAALAELPDAEPYS